MVQQKIAFVGKTEENEELHLIAEAGVKRAVAELRKYPDAFAALDAACLNNRQAFKDVPVGRGTFTVSVRSQDLDAQDTVFYGFSDEEGKININYAPPQVLARLLANAGGMEQGEAERLGAIIVDYRDTDQATREGFSEEYYYAGADASFRLKNYNFEFLDELRTIKGMSPEIFTAVGRYLTVYGEGLVNINTCPTAVLEALGFSRTLAVKILSFRAGRDGITGTSDDNVVRDLKNYIPALAGFIQIEANETESLTGFLSSGAFTVSSSFVRVYSSGLLNSRKKVCNITCVCDIRGNMPYWKETISSI
jgi:hypothetical protein